MHLKIYMAILYLPDARSILASKTKNWSPKKVRGKERQHSCYLCSHYMFFFSTFSSFILFVIEHELYFTVSAFPIYNGLGHYASMWGVCNPNFLVWFQLHQIADVPSVPWFSVKLRADILMNVWVQLDRLGEGKFENGVNWAQNIRKVLYVFLSFNSFIKTYKKGVLEILVLWKTFKSCIFFSASC